MMARPVIKFASVSRDQAEELRHIWKSHRLHSVRLRAHAILLSHRRYSPADIADVLDAHVDTVRRWIDHFNERGCDGLEDEDRPGGSPALDDGEQIVLKNLIETYPNQPRKVLAELQQQTGKEISRTSLRRYCHRLGLRWKRFRRSLKHRRDERAFRKAQREIAQLLGETDVDVVYFDEAGMTLRGVVPYGWQPIGVRTEVPVSGGSQPSLQLLGIQRTDETVRCYLHRGRVTSQTVIDVLDDFADTIERPTVLILDNAPVHGSAKFESRVEYWSGHDLYVYFLPPYSPELNMIERFWKKLKYQLMPQDAWEYFTDLVACAKACIDNVGIAIPMPSLRVNLG